MLQAFHILTVLMVAIGMGLSLAHALEFPGKRRLGEGAYREVQRIYYPGGMARAARPLGMVARRARRPLVPCAGGDGCVADRGLTVRLLDQAGTQPGGHVDSVAHPVGTAPAVGEEAFHLVALEGA